MISANNIISR